MKTKGKIKDIYPLSPMQEGMFFHHLYDKSSFAYFEQVSYRMNGKLNIPYVEKSLNELLKRHDILRTAFIQKQGKRLLQAVLKEREIDFFYKDISKKDDKSDYLIQFKEEDKKRSFNLSKDVLMRVSIFKTGDAEYEFTWSFHHILIDGWCIGILISEFFEIYHSFLENRPYRLPEVKQYKTYIQWLEKQDKEISKNYWRNYLDGNEEAVVIPGRISFKAVDSVYKQQKAVFQLEEEKTDRLNHLTVRNNVTLNTLIQAVWGVLLGKYNGKTDVVFGAVVSGRPPEIEGSESMVGLFINTIPVRLKYEADISFSELLKKNHEEAIDTRPHHYYPLADIQSESTLKQNLLHHILVFENYPVAPNIEGISKRSEEKEKQIALKLSNVNTYEQSNYDLHIVIASANRLSVKFTYNANVYDSHAFERIVKHFGILIDQILTAEQIAVNRLTLLSKEEKRKILVDFNDTETGYPKDKTIHRLFEEQVERTPDHIALTEQIFKAFDPMHLSYRELNEKTNQLAHLLIEKGVEPDTIVSIMAGRSIEMIIGIVGILKAGGAYLPIDPEYPPERKQYMLADSNAKIVLTSDAINRVPTPGYLGPAPCALRPANTLAYVLYTSGSTGFPKAVTVEHRSVVRLVTNTNFYQFDENDRLLQTGALDFDASTFEIWGSLLNGLNLYLVSKDNILSAGTLKEITQKHSIDTMWMTAPLFNRMLDADIEIFAPLSNLLVGGDVLTPLHINKLRNRFPRLHVTNGYGPTENTTFSCTYAVEAEHKESIPIGSPIANSTAYIVDTYNHLVPVGVVGELVVGGDGVARGYLNKPELTAEKFLELEIKVEVEEEEEPREQIPNKHMSYIYRTGDLARWLPDGNIEFLGRIDHQVKIRGFRIELGEIESQLLKKENIQEAVVLAKEKRDREKYLCAYIMSREKLDVPELRGYLSSGLPDYMIPSFFVQVEKIPLNPNGKVDRKALPEPVLESKDNYAPPTDEIELKLVDIWSKVLNIDGASIGVDADFFELGGHSLKATIMASDIHKKMDVKIPLAEIFETPTIRELAGYIRTITRGSARDAFAPIEPAEEKEYYPLSPAQKRLYVLNQLVADNTGYNVPQTIYPGESIHRERLEQTFKKLIARHESFRTSFIEVDNVPFQQIHREVDFTVDSYEAGGAEIEDVIDNFIRPFDLSRAPLIRVYLINLGGSRQAIFIDIHHIIIDAASHSILRQEFMSLYSNPGAELPGLRLTHKDYSQWHQGEELRGTLSRQKAFWLKEFPQDDEITLLNLPFDYPRPLIQNFEGNHVSFALTVEETTIIKEIAKENEITLFMCLLVLFNILYSKLSGQEDIILGVPAAARRHADLQHVVGMLVNTTAMRNYPTANKTFNVFLQEVKQQTLKAYENQEYPFEALVDNLLVNRDTGRNPIFDVMLSMINTPNFNFEINTREIQALTSYSYKHRKAVSRFDLIFNSWEAGEHIYLGGEYSSRLFKPQTIDRFINYFRHMVRVLPAYTKARLCHIPIMSEEEKKGILDLSAGYEEKADTGPTLHRGFEVQVEQTPDKIAVAGGSWTVGKKQKNRKTARVQLTYRELNQRANRLARLLMKRGLESGAVVGLLVERSVEMIISILAVIKAGGTYLPIDPAYPEQRILTMLDDSDVSILLILQETLDRFSITALKNMKANKENLVVTSPQVPIKDFDQLPKPDRTLIDYKKYHQSIGLAMAKHTVSLQATRGCPFNCAYCHKIWPKTHVVRSDRSILNEIKCCYDCGIRRFVFIDDIFNLDKKNSSRVFESIIKQDLDIQLFFPNGLRADILDKEIIDLMMEAGAVNFAVALESASPRIQKLIRKNLNLEKFEENVRYITGKYPQLILEMEMMLGFPTETEKEALMTLEFLEQLKWVHFPYLNILKIYPNTDMFKLAVEHGISEDRIERSVNLAYHELPETLPFSKAFVKEFQTRLMNEYILSRERLLDVLPNQMKTLSGDELVEKYNSYLPMEIKSVPDILHYAGITGEELGDTGVLLTDHMAVPDFNEKVRKYFPSIEIKAEPFKVLLLDLSLLFSREAEQIHMLYDMIEEPLGLLYLLTYLHDRFKSRVWGKIAKSRVDFDSYQELKNLIQEFKPDLIGIRTLSFFKEFFHKTVLMIRQWGVEVPIVAGGPYATSDYNLILQDPHIDIVVLGEGELTLAQLVEKMMENQGLPDQETLREIPGIVFMAGRDRESRRVKARDILLVDEIPMEFDQYSPANMGTIHRENNSLYVIYTSGSTGRPKGVILEHRNLANLIRYQYRHTDIDFSRVLQFTTISFDVSAQEIFSTLLAGGHLSLVSTETLTDIPALFRRVEKDRIKTLFLPTSFLKFIMNEEEFLRLIPGSVDHIVTAGEQAVINESFKRYLKESRVYFHNHYGPSETHVVTALTIAPGEDISELPPIGRPITNTWIYILDKGYRPVPAGVPGELLVSGFQVGRGYLNRPELTAEKFIRLPMHGRLHKTGDLARWLADKNIEFLGRMDQQVKIRGFRVELEEIERQLLNYPGIKKAAVMAGASETDEKYLCAYMVSDSQPAASELREYLGKNLPDYMIPSYFVWLEKIPLTPNGKINRKALPEPALKNRDSYKVPTTKTEWKLVDIWSEVLNINKAFIDLDSNFFELGGHSLKATILISKIHKEFNINVPLAEIFKAPNIKGLSRYVSEAREDKYETVNAAEEKEYYPLTAAQKGIFVQHQRERGNLAYNMPEIVTLNFDIDKKQLEQTFKALIDRHKSLRTSFHLIHETPAQKINRNIAFRCQYHEVEDEEQTRKVVREFIRTFDLTSPPLIRAGLISVKQSKRLLIVDMHHIISDGLSHDILRKDFVSLYNGEQLPSLKLQYKDYAQWENSAKVKEEINQQVDFWLKGFEDGIPTLKLPTDFKRPSIRSFEGDHIRAPIGRRLAEQLEQLGEKTGATLFMILLAVYFVLLAKYSNQEDIVVGSPVTGRKHVDLYHIVGMFVNMLAIRTQPHAAKIYEQFLTEVKEQVIQCIDNRQYHYKELVSRLGLEDRPGRNPLFDVVFSMFEAEGNLMENQGGEDQTEHEESTRGSDSVPYSFEYKISKFDLLLQVNRFQGQMSFMFEYSTRLFKRSTVEEMSRHYMEILQQVVENPAIKLENIKMSYDLAAIESTGFQEEENFNF